MAHNGAWHATIPPPGPECVACGAVDAASDPVIPMSPRPTQHIPRVFTTIPPVAEILPWTTCSNNYQWQAV